jgi:hypothetical protein
MKKLKMIADDLRVESFDASRAGEGARGTVRAHDWSRFGEQTCGGMSCDYACITVYDDTCRDVCA